VYDLAPTLIRGAGIDPGMSMRVTMQATMSVRADFARHNLNGAAYAARRTFDIENAGQAETLGPGFDEIMAVVPVAVSMSGAALEGNSNELIQDLLDMANRTGRMTEATKVLLAELKEDRTGNAIDRYRSIALLQGKIPNPGDARWGEAALLVKLRNSFMHFKPNWQSVDDEPDKLAKTVQRKFRTAKPYVNNALYMFPNACLTYECAKWSIDTVLNFSKAISERLEIPDRFASWQSPVPLP
jgi:hypothetical protein